MAWFYHVLRHGDSACMDESHEGCSSMVKSRIDAGAARRP